MLSQRRSNAPAPTAQWYRADAGIAADLDHGSAAALGDLPELAVRAFHGLVVSGNAQVKYRALLYGP
jgi:hypothetical protein